MIHHAKRIEWGVPASLVALSLVPAIAGTVRMMKIASAAPMTPENARFIAAPLPVLLHIPAAMVFSLLGALQFAPAFRRRHREWHRASGRIVAASGVLVALSGLWMSHFYAWPPGDGQLVYAERLVVGVGMLGAIALAVLAIRRRDFRAHGAWMIRAYALGLGAGTQVFTHLPWILFAHDTPGTGARGVMMGAGWAINIIAAEWIIRGRSVSGQRRSPGAREIALPVSIGSSNSA